ncbi:hypothetical protein FOXYS1_9791 [Fusarium oxysporum]|uniref:Uncharacterized protein n=1 Tax=Fusarium oxysporum TaxID=5507 RepID=A0A8H5A7M5_FUSOX|nr:hypothetical protein FOXYS1_9791 [Fusarium oxysporum]
MASAIKSALPTHLKPNSGDEQGNERRHGKTRSHMMDLVTGRAFTRSLMALKCLDEGAKLRLRLPLPTTNWTTDLNKHAFENTSTNVAAAQMRNALTNLAETVKDPEQKKASPLTRNM